MGQLQVHRCRFLDCTRPYVTTLAFNLPSPGPGPARTTSAPSDLRLAVGRSNGDIEIWDPHRWSLDVTLAGARDRSIEGLAWATADDQNKTARLFSIGASDAITEWDLATGRPLAHYGAESGVIWAIEVSPDGRSLAVACETGTVVVFDIGAGTPGECEYVKRLQPADASLAALAWKNDGQIVAGGSDARLRVWDVATGRIVGTMKVDKSARSREGTVVWTIRVLRNRGEQIVSGDSNGYIKTWDGRTLTLQQSFQAHQGDVLCLCAAGTDQDTVFSSGLDQKIVCSRMTDVRHRRWTVMSSRVAASHDIRGMAVYDASARGGVSYLVSGGLERTFVVGSAHRFEDRPHRKIALARPLAPALDTAGGRFVVEWRETRVQMWLLENGSKRLLLQLRSADEEYVTSASLDAEHGRLAVATYSKVKVYELSFSSEGKISSLTLRDPIETGARFVKFSPSGSLVVVSADGDEPICEWNPETSQLSEFDEPADLRDRRQRASSLAYVNSPSLVALGSDLVAVARPNRYIELYSVSRKAHVASLPAVAETPAALTFRKGGNGVDDRLVVATVDNNVWEFDTTTQNLTPWSRTHSGRLPSQLTSQADVCCGVFVYPDDTNRVWLWGASWLAYLDLTRSLVPVASLQSNRKRRHGESGPAESDGEGAEDADGDDVPDAEPEAESARGDEGFWLTRQYRPLFFAGPLGSDIMVSEQPPLESDVRPFWSNRHIRL